MGSPEGPLEEAATYLRISFLTTLCPMLYYLYSCAFRGMGDSRTDLYCLLVSVVSNIFLDLLFVAVFHWGVAGSAWATALAQLMSALFAALLLQKKYPQMRLRHSDIRPDGKILTTISKLALPIALQTAFNNLGNLVAQTAVNAFGTVAMAAYTAAGRVGTVALVPLESIGSSLSVYAGQNYGAKKPERIREGVRAGIKLELLASVILGAVIVLFGRAIAALFLTEPSEELLKICRSYLLITALPCFLAGIMFVYQQTLRGIGKTADSMRGGILQLAVKITIIVIGAAVAHRLTVMWYAWPLSFASAALFLRHRYKRWNAESLMAE
jgi:putative MATE family efflux protein